MKLTFSVVGYHTLQRVVIDINVLIGVVNIGRILEIPFFEAAFHEKGPTLQLFRRIVLEYFDCSEEIWKDKPQ